MFNDQIVTIMDKLDGDCFELISETNDDAVGADGADGADGAKVSVFRDILKQVICYNSLLYKLCKFNHHDLKTNNIFYRTRGDHNEFFLADFGMSRIVVTYGNKHYNITCDPLKFTNQLPSSKSYDIMLLLVSSIVTHPHINVYIFNTMLKKLNINLQIGDDDTKNEWAYDMSFNREFIIDVLNWYTLYTPEMFLFIRHYFDHVDFSDVFGFSSTCEGITKFDVRGLRPSSATLTSSALSSPETIPVTEVHPPIAERRIDIMTPPIIPIHEGGNQQKIAYRFIMK